MFVSNNRASFHLRGKENLVKHQKGSKYYENDYTLLQTHKSNIILITLEARYFSCVLTTYGKYVTVTFRFGSPFYCILYYVRITLLMHLIQ